MNKLTIILGTFLVLGVASNAVFAKNGNNPTPVTIVVNPTPDVDPVVPPATNTLPITLTGINAQPIGGTTFALFYIDIRKVASATQEIAILASHLSPYGLTPCRISADVNYTPISCGGLVKFGINQLYTYGRPLNLQRVPIATNKGVKQVFAANFLSPVGLIPGDSVGRSIHVHFTQPVVRFAMNIDSGQAATPSIDSITIVEGPIGSQVSVSQNITPGTTQWVGVESADGFTDLDIIPVGGPTGAQAYVTDQISIVTKAQVTQ